MALQLGIIGAGSIGQAGHDLQRYVIESMLYQSVTILPFLQAARTSVRGSENLHGPKIRLETTWLDKP
jgi:hypothetical protein